MNIADVTRAVATIADIGSGDPEAAHSREDDLYESVLRAIADGLATDPVAMAKEALKTKDIEFPRWCA